MTSKVASSASASGTGYGSLPRSAPDDVAAAADTPEAEAAESADLRLLIEEGAGPGQYIYTIVDRRTGRVVSRRARDEVLKLRDDSSYAAGKLFDGKA